MSGKETWFITGAGRGMGVDIARAALGAGHTVVATGRNTEAVREALGESDDLLIVELDITRIASAEAAVRAAFDRFGRIDVLVNNAGNFFAGFFEELSPDQVRAQRNRRAGVLLRLCRLQVRRRGVDGVAAVRGRAVRHPYHDRRAGLLSHRAAHEGIHRLRLWGAKTQSPQFCRRIAPGCVGRLLRLDACRRRSATCRSKVYPRRIGTDGGRNRRSQSPPGACRAQAMGSTIIHPQPDVESGHPDKYEEPRP